MRPLRAGSGASQVNATSDVKNVLPPALGILWTAAAVAPRTLLLLTLPGYGLPKPQCAAAVRRPLEAAPQSSFGRFAKNPHDKKILESWDSSTDLTNRSLYNRHSQGLWTSVVFSVKWND